MDILTHDIVTKNNFISRIKKRELTDGFDSFIDEWKALFPKGMKISDQSRKKIAKHGWGVNDILNLATISLEPAKYKSFKKYIEEFMKYNQESYRVRLGDFKAAKVEGIDPKMIAEELLERQSEIRQNKIHGLLKYLFVILKRQA